jgi:hypothetical protein
MKYMLVAILALASLTSCSHKHKHSQWKHEEMPKQLDAMSFEELKTWKTQLLTAKQEMIKEEQTCIDVAKDKDGLKKCSENLHEKMKEKMKEVNKKK